MVGYVTGLFDIFSIRDLDLLRGARRHCDRLVVGVVGDGLADCLVPLEERAEILRNVRYVDEVRELDSWDLEPAHASVGFDLMVLADGQEEPDLPVRVVRLSGLRETESAELRTVLRHDAPAADRGRTPAA
ncbi:hypothetical protein [Actinocorallia sp. A-T 12471]|uniref:hypothetical protein n=1 Tax=Actinocorallia sp. A-T 12471 TaxID=3089813 RepID=UPI0029D0F94C|nr:hypothetical protein [Actinocorallia sp. A-T 12471]MDX6738507.1 hypothetical protein [Actinocorallia sp. A-T 12471]